MSGIYIKGMEMPKSCFQCEFRTKIDPDHLMCIISQKTFEDRFYHIEHRDQSCPLVPVRHGRWIKTDDFSYEPIDWVVCDKCKAKIPDFDYSYCPNCGAKMDLTNNQL